MRVLPAIPLHWVEILVVAEREVAAPAWPADALRRALDTAARRLVEAGRLGVDFLDWWDPRTAGGNRPRPFTLCAEAGERLSPVAPLRATLTLFGAGARVAEVVAVVEDAVGGGLAGTAGARLRCVSRVVRGAAGAMAAGDGPWPAAAGLDGRAVPPRGAPVRVRFPVPLQLDKERPRPGALTAAVLFHRALTRMHALCRLTGAWDGAEWAAPGPAVAVERRVRAVSPQLPGSAGRGHAPLYGLVGEVGVEGDTGDLGALMVAAAGLGLGRGTVMGLGVVELG